MSQKTTGRAIIRIISQRNFLIKALPVGKKDVLTNISGEFRGSELSIIIGQSGSGKSCLLNILSGFTKKHVSGSVKLNGKFNETEIRLRSKYIMQDYSLHRYITVKEAMIFAANLKLGHSYHPCERWRKVKCSTSDSIKVLLICIFSNFRSTTFSRNLVSRL